MIKAFVINAGVKPSMPEVGDYLFASCSQEDYGRVLRVGKDVNGADVMDIVVLHPQDLIHYEHRPNQDGIGWQYPVTTLELPPGEVVLCDLQWRSKGNGYVECNTPGNGCYRCTKYFQLRKEASP